MELPPSRARLAHRAGLALLVVPLVALAVLALVSSSSADRTGVGYVTSDNVTWIRTLPEASDGVGARVVGNRLFVTTTKDLIVYDITNPTDPRRLGSFNVNIEFENEEVPSNGKLLGISGEIGGCAPAGVAPVLDDNCLVIYDVSGDTPQPLKVVADAGDHTATCILDCTYFWGSEGAVVDARKPAEAELVGNWSDGLKFDRSGRCHHQNEVSPGIIIAACQPIYLLSVRAEDGGSVTRPKVLAKYAHEDKRFVHGVRWPNGGTDKFILGGGETNFQPRCSDTVGAFMVFDATRRSARGNWTMTDEKRPQNGTYQNGGNGQTQILGCSAHWFEEHPAFKNGGVVALAEYEQGTRFLQITPEGKIRQLGYFLPVGGSTSAPHWAPDGRTVYAIDYTRGLDVLRYEGPLPAGGELPPQVTAPGESPLPESGASSARGTGASSCASNAGFDAVAVKGGRVSVDRKAERPFSFSLFQQSRGRDVIANRLVRRVRSTTRSSLRLPSRAASGMYLARVTMDLPGTDDVRRIVLQRSAGAWRVRPDAYLRNACGALASFKLDRAVFGGPRGRSLGVSYRLPQGVDKVSIQVLRGRRVVGRKRGGTSARAYRFTVPASIAPAGSDVRVRLVVERAGAKVTETLTARRL